MFYLPEINFFFVGILVLLLLLFWMLYSMYKKQMEIEHKEEEVLHNYKSILHRAHAKARNLLNKTTDQAGNILADSGRVRREVNEELENALAQVVNRHVYTLDRHSEDAFTAYKKALEEVKTIYVAELKKDVDGFKKATEEELTDFKAMLSKETLDAQVSVGHQITDAFQKAQQDIATYKVQQMAKVDDQIRNVVQKVSFAVMKSAITPAQHEELLKKALDEARIEGLFD